MESSGPGSSSAARRPQRWLLMTSVLQLVALAGVLSILGHAVLTQPRYESPGQTEIDTYRNALRDSPDSLAANLSLAYAYQQAGRFDDALAHYDTVLRLVPAETAALSNKGVILLEVGETAQGVATLRASLDVNPGHVLSATTLAEHYLAEGEYRAALGVLLPAANANPRSAELHYLTGLTHENLDDLEAAAERYRLALSVYPDMSEARDALERIGASQ